MPISRSAAIAHLDNQFYVIDAAVGSNITAYGGDVSQALRRLGVAESQLSTVEVVDANRGAFLALAEYYALRRFSRKLALKVDSTLGPMSEKSSGIFSQVEKLMKEAAGEAAGFGYPVDASPAWSLGILSLDYIEPEPNL